MLTERGNCTFFSKAAAAEQSQISLLIIGNSKYENINKILMVKENNNQHVTIPSVLIPKSDSDELIEVLRNNVIVTVHVIFEQNNKTNPVEIEYWYNPMAPESCHFLDFYLSQLDQFKDNVILRPRFPIYFCQTCKEQNFKYR